MGRDRADPPVGFGIATPGDWFDLDLNPATRSLSIASLVDERIAGTPDIASRRQDMLRILRRSVRDAAERGVAFASMMVEAADGHAITASLLGSAHPSTAMRPDDACLRPIWGCHHPTTALARPQSSRFHERDVDAAPRALRVEYCRVEHGAEHRDASGVLEGVSV